MIGRFNIASTVLVGMSQSVSVRAERCNRMCHKSSQCNLCETNCPTQAISVGAVGTRINIKWEQCSYCGICVNICPTGVFGVRDLGYTGFLKTYLKKLTDDGTLTLSCKEYLRTKAAEEEQAERESLINKLSSPKQNQDYAVFECMGILSVPDLLYFYTHGAKEIRLLFPDCAGCVNKFGKEIIDDEICELKKLFEYFEHLQGTTVEEKDGKITIKFTAEFERIPPEKVEKEVRMAETVTRRGMFDLMRHNLTDTALRSAVLLTPQEIPGRTPFRTEKELPIKRRLFLDSLSNLGKLLKTKMPSGPYFFSQRIDPRCNFCKICTRFCHTGALHMSENDDKILFTAAECTSCGMCLIACYHKYIHAESSQNLCDFFDEVLRVEKPDEKK